MKVVQMFVKWTVTRRDWIPEGRSSLEVAALCAHDLIDWSSENDAVLLEIPVKNNDYFHVSFWLLQ